MYADSGSSHVPVDCALAILVFLFLVLTAKYLCDLSSAANLLVSGFPEYSILGYTPFGSLNALAFTSDGLFKGPEDAAFGLFG